MACDNELHCVKAWSPYFLPPTDGYVSSSTLLIATEKTGKSAQFKDKNASVNQISLAGKYK